MALFKLQYDGMSFTTDHERKTEFTMTPTQAAEFIEQCKARGELPAGVVGIHSAKVYRDDPDAPDDDDGESSIELTAGIELLVEAPNERAAELEYARYFLGRIVMHLVENEDALGFGDTDAFELVDTEAFELSVA